MVWTAAPGERSEVPGHRKQAALKDQRFEHRHDAISREFHEQIPGIGSY
jgi:hypothetical protein